MKKNHYGAAWVDSWRKHVQNVRRRLDSEATLGASDEITAIKGRCSLLRSRYKFLADFNLEDALIGLLRSYRRSLPMLSDIGAEMEKHRNRMRIIEQTRSLNGATLHEVFELIVFGDLQSIEEPSDSTSRHKLMAAMRGCARHREEQKLKKGAHKLGGRYANLANNNLARGLALTYYRGTGRLPSTGYSSRTGMRGTYIRFAHECLRLLNVRITDRQIEKFMLEVRRYFRPIRRPRRILST